MGILTKMIEKRFHVSQDPPGWIDRAYGLETTSGVLVNEESAMQFIAVFACIRILAETVASLPLVTYRRLADGGKERAADFYLYELLHDRPNPEMTSFELRETMMAHTAAWGNSYAQIVSNQAGEISALWPLRPDRMMVERVSGLLRYTYRLTQPDENGNTTRVFLPDEILHIRGLSSNGLTGYSNIAIARNAIALGMAAEEFGGRFFGNDARPGIVLEHPGKLSDPAYKHLQTSWEDRHQGVSKSHRPAILEEGLKLHEIGIPPQDAQFMELRKFQITEIARLFRIPPHMLADLERSTFSNIEHQGIEFVVHTIRPWLVRWEQALNRKLYTESERSTYYSEFLVDGLLRGDTASRYAAYATGRQNGWLSANDIREIENMNPVDGGNIYLIPMNMIPVGTPPVAKEAREQGSTGAGEQEKRSVRNDQEQRLEWARTRLHIARSYKTVLLDAAERSIKRETQDLKQAIDKYLKRGDINAFNLWLAKFYPEYLDVLKRIWKPAFWGLGQAIQAAAAKEVGGPVGMTPGLEECLSYHLERAATRYTEGSQNLIQTIIANAAVADQADTLIEAVDGWVSQRAASVSTWEATRISGLMTKATYFYNSVKGLEWVLMDDNPFCKSLNGKSIPMGESCRGTHFAPKGTKVIPTERSEPNVLVPSWNVATPPLFNGCECQIVAVREV